MAVQCAVRGGAPIGDGLRDQACFRVMVREQFGLGCNDVWEGGFQGVAMR